MKKIIILALVCFVVFAGLSACDGREKLYILNWDEYLDEELIDKFELEYNCKVIYNIAESNEIMYSQLESEYAPYDIVFPSDYMIAQMHNKNLIKEIDFTKLVNYNETNFDDNLMNLINRDCATIQNYFVPYFWGSLGIMYNTDVLSSVQIEKIHTDGFKVLFDNGLANEVGNKVAMYASSRDSIASALLSMGVSLNTQNKEDILKAEEVLKQVSYKAWATDDLKLGVASGKYAYSLVYSGDFFDVLYSTLEEEDAEVNFDIYCPEDGNNVFFDGMVIPTICQNEELAYEFIDFMITYENSLTNAQFVGYCPTLKVVYNSIVADPDFEDVALHEAYYPGDIKNGEVYQYLGPEIYNLYEEIYKRVNAS